MIDAAVILVIEDDPSSLELARYLLETSGHRPITADNGGDGLRLALGGTCDLVLCDLQMPVLDGFQVVSALLANPHWSRVPVIAVTALSMEGDRETALGAELEDTAHVLLVLFGLFTFSRLFTQDGKGRLKSLNIGNARAKRRLGFLQISLQMSLTLLCRAHEIE